MSKTTASAAGAAMPAAATSRRSLLVALAATPALAVPAMASAAQGDDAELLALEAEICRLNEQSDEIIATRADPFEQEYDRILAPKSANFEAITNETWKAASEFGERCGGLRRLRRRAGSSIGPTGYMTACAKSRPERRPAVRQRCGRSSCISFGTNGAAQREKSTPPKRSSHANCWASSRASPRPSWRRYRAATVRWIRIVAGRALISLGITLSALGIALLKGSGWRSSARE